MQHRGREVSSNFFFFYTPSKKSAYSYIYIYYVHMHAIYPPKPSQVALTHNNHLYKLKHTCTQYNHSSSHARSVHDIYSVSVAHSLQILLQRDRRIKKKKKHSPRNSLSSEWSVKRRKARSLCLPTIGSAHIFFNLHMSASVPHIKTKQRHK